MAVYTESSPSFYENLRLMASSACFSQSAISAGMIWGNNELEDIIDNRTDRDKDYTGIYNDMLLGNLPRIITCKRIQTNTHSRKLMFWRNNPFWGLFIDSDNHSYYIQKSLQLAKGEIKSLISDKNVYTRRNPKNYDGIIESIDNIAKHKNFSALLTLTALAVERHDSQCYFTEYDAAFKTREIFADVVCTTPQLFIRWPYLVELYMQRIWSLDYPFKDMFWHENEPSALIDEIKQKEKHYRKLRNDLPPKALMRRINKNNPYYN